MKLAQKTPLDGMDKTIGACRLREITDVCMVSAAMPLGKEKSFGTALEKVYGMPVPTGTQSLVSKTGRAIRSTPDQVLLMLNDSTGPAAKDVRAAMADKAYTTDQTDSWVMIELSGGGAINALERICPIDLHPSVFPVNAFARTTMEHIGATIVRTGDDSFLLMSASSSAKSFAHAIEQSMEYTS